MHYKLSALPAEVFTLHNRSTLVEGQAAGLMICGYEKLGCRRFRYEIAHDLPGGEWRRVCKPEGIERVMVNGGTTFVNGTDGTGALPGRLLGSNGPETDFMLAVAAE